MYLGTNPPITANDSICPALLWSEPSTSPTPRRLPNTQRRKETKPAVKAARGTRENLPKRHALQTTKPVRLPGVRVSKPNRKRGDRGHVMLRIFGDVSVRITAAIQNNVASSLRLYKIADHRQSLPATWRVCAVLTNAPMQGATQCQTEQRAC